MKKYLCIGCFILLLSLSLLLLGSIKPVKAETQQATITPTPTLEMELWFRSPTPPVLGSCPDARVDPNLDLSYKYQNLCGNCIATGTPPFPTSKPPTATGTVTIQPTTTATPSPTPTLVLGGVTVVSQYDYYANPAVYINRVQNTIWNHHREGDVYSLKDELYIRKPAGSYPHKIGVQFYGDETVPAYYGYTISHKYTIQAMTGVSIKIKFHTGKRAGQEHTLPAGGSLDTFIYSFAPYGDGNWFSWNETFDITLLGGGSGENKVRIYNTRVTFNFRNLTQDHNWKWIDGGTFYFPPIDGYCRVPELSGGAGQEFFNIGMYPFWIGQGSCINTNFMTDWLNNQTIQDILTAITGSPLLIESNPINICFRQFSLTIIRLFGIDIDVMFILYMFVGVYLVKNLFALT